MALGMRKINTMVCKGLYFFKRNILHLYFDFRCLIIIIIKP